MSERETPETDALRAEILARDSALWKDCEDMEALAIKLERERDEAREEMRRYLPILRRAEECPTIWNELTKGTGIATLNGYEAKAKPPTGGPER